MLRQKATKHPKSLWRDQSMMPRQFEENEESDIFKIIMPWVAEKQEEEDKD